MEKLISDTDELINQVMKLSNFEKVDNWLKEICLMQQKEIKLLNEKILKIYVAK